LPRPDDLLATLLRVDARELPDDAAYREQVANATVEVVRQQITSGVDIVNDGELGKVSYASYVKDRLTGFEGESKPRPQPLEIQAFPDFYRRSRRGEPVYNTPACTSPIAWKGDDLVRQDIATLKVALERTGGAAGAFMSSISPGGMWYIMPNEYYADHEAFIFAAAEAMKAEYRAIVEAGFLLQLDCPDLAGGWNRADFADKAIDDFRRMVAMHVDALNYAVADLPADRVRMHVCWGNHEGPHLRDVALRDIIDLILPARPQGLSIEAANPRHEHEWKVFEGRRLPDGKVLIPGVLDTTTNFVEHPELVAQRIVRFAQNVGRENVVAGTDCGFATFAGRRMVDSTIVWLKLQAMAEGARLATAELWG
jgi:5-methyltetrahydropteroyltriglutamate--homocysteine methyltransferase